MSVLRGNIARVTPAENEDEEVLESWTNPYIAEYERRSDFLKATNEVPPFSRRALTVVR
ncbi:Uncharacterised protein [Mycobacteroides abscessus subsp. abscessus]|nr:Uncharacterised protein [Mycobacteroides abscessus subsp. abscessus]